VIRAGRFVLLLLLLRWTVIFFFWPMRQDVIGAAFLHTIELPFHEAGHIIFMPLGDLMMSLGGSLGQVLVPIVCMVAFLTTSPNPFGAAVMAWWAGENLMDVAVYINDARDLNLILLGGVTGKEVEGHDWEHILTVTNLLAYDHRIAAVVQFLGGLAMVAALAWGAVIALQKDAQ